MGAMGRTGRMWRNPPALARAQYAFLFPVVQILFAATSILLAGCRVPQKVHKFSLRGSAAPLACIWAGACMSHTTPLTSLLMCMHMRMLSSWHDMRRMFVHVAAGGDCGEAACRGASSFRCPRTGGSARRSGSASGACHTASSSAGGFSFSVSFPCSLFSFLVLLF